MNEQQDAAVIRRWFNAHVESRLLHAAIELQLLNPLLGRPYTAVALATKHGYDPHGVRVLLQGLAGLGIVARKGNNQYELVKIHQAAFDPSSQLFIGSAVTKAQQFWETAGHLENETFVQLVSLAKTARRQAALDLL